MSVVEPLATTASAAAVVASTGKRVDTPPTRRGSEAAAAGSRDNPAAPVAPSPAAHLSMMALAGGWVGKTFARRYAVERVLGVGGMSYVLAARHKGTGRRVAIKVVPEPSDDPRVVERVLLEARIPAAVRHPGLPEVYDVAYDRDARGYYLVSELLVGHDLRAELRGRPGGKIPPREAVAMLAPLIAALSACHRAGVVHCDLKPENVFLARPRHGEGRGSLEARPIDFGVARTAIEGIVLDPALRERDTAGTAVYMSPEQIDGDPDIDARADVWSLGVLLYEMLAGRTPFAAATLPALCLRIQADEPEPLTLEREGVPGHVWRAIARALAKRRADRWPTAGHFLAALRDPAAVACAPAGATSSCEVTTILPPPVAFGAAETGCPAVPPPPSIPPAAVDDAAVTEKITYRPPAFRGRAAVPRREGTSAPSLVRRQRRSSAVAAAVWIAAALLAVLAGAGLGGVACVGGGSSGRVVVVSPARWAARMDLFLLARGRAMDLAMTSVRASRVYGEALPCPLPPVRGSVAISVAPPRETLRVAPSPARKPRGRRPRR